MYIEAANLYSVFGQRNVTIWADLDGQGDLSGIAAAIATAIEYGEAYVTDRMREAHYALPLVALSSTALVTVKFAMAQIAGWRLYFGRGFRDNEVVEARMTGHKADADSFLDRVLSGQIRLDLERLEQGPNAPAVV